MQQTYIILKAPCHLCCCLSYVRVCSMTYMYTCLLPFYEDKQRHTEYWNTVQHQGTDRIQKSQLESVLRSCPLIKSLLFSTMALSFFLGCHIDERCLTCFMFHLPITCSKTGTKLMISTTSFGIANFMESITVQGTQRLVILLSASGNPLNKIESRSKLAATSEHLSSAYQKQGRQRVHSRLVCLRVWWRRIGAQICWTFTCKEWTAGKNVQANCL